MQLLAEHLRARSVSCTVMNVPVPAVEYDHLVGPCCGSSCMSATTPEQLAEGGERTPRATEDGRMLVPSWVYRRRPMSVAVI
jgi:hypothetical protein